MGPEIYRMLMDPEDSFLYPATESRRFFAMCHAESDASSAPDFLLLPGWLDKTLPVPSDPPAARVAKGLCLQARGWQYGASYNVSMAEIELSSQLPAFTMSFLEAGKAVPDWESAVPWLLMTLTAMSAGTPRMELEEVLPEILDLPEMRDHAARLAETLAGAAGYLCRKGQHKSADSYLSRAYWLIQGEEHAVTPPVFDAFVNRASNRSEADYGPGAFLEGMAGPLRNALCLAGRLSCPDLASKLPARFLDAPDRHGLSFRDLELARVGVELPRSSAFRLAWSALETDLRFREDRAGVSAADAGPSSAESPDLKDPARLSDSLRSQMSRNRSGTDPGGMFPEELEFWRAARAERAYAEESARSARSGESGAVRAAAEAAREALEAVEAVSGELGLGGFGARGAAAVPAYRAASVLGALLSGLDGAGADRLMGIAGPARAAGDMGSWCFEGLVSPLLERSPSVFAGALMRTAARGHLGSGGGLVQALAASSFICGKAGVRLSGFADEARAVRLAASVPRAPCGLKVASCLLGIESEARTLESPDGAFRGLAQLWEENAGEGEAAGTDGPEDRTEDPCYLVLYAFASALAFASWWRQDGLESTEPPRRAGHGAAPADGDAARAVRVARLARLAAILPERARMTPGFLDRMMPQAVLAAQAGGGDSGRESAGELAEALSGAWGGAHLHGLRAFWLIAEAEDAPPADPDDFRRWLRRACELLAGELPPNLRAFLVGAACAGFGYLRLPDQMEDFLLDSFAILVPPVAGDEGIGTDPEGISCHPGMRVTLPGRRGLSLDTLLPGPDLPSEAVRLPGGISDLEDSVMPALEGITGLMNDMRKSMTRGRLMADMPQFRERLDAYLAESSSLPPHTRVLLDTLDHMMDNGGQGFLQAFSKMGVVPEVTDSDLAGSREEPGLHAGAGKFAGGPRRKDAGSGAREGASQPLPPAFSKWLASELPGSGDQTPAGAAGRPPETSAFVSASEIRLPPEIEGTDLVRRARGMILAAEAALELPSGVTGPNLKAISRIMRGAGEAIVRAAAGETVPSWGRARVVCAMTVLDVPAAGGRTQAPERTPPSGKGWLEWLGPDDELRRLDAKAAAARASAEADGWLPVPLSGGGTMPVTVAATCLAECGRYHRALEYLNRDLVVTVSTSLRWPALAKILEGLARSGMAGQAAPAMTLLKAISEREGDPSIAQRAMKILAAAPKGGGGTRKKQAKPGKGKAGGKKGGGSGKRR
ncbi:MAG: hypothetical protein LBT40_05935 [Deltaproteobacteria bacterium]|nr:hypothetical protein [Deltaproteobacteria bacterium]